MCLALAMVETCGLKPITSLLLGRQFWEVVTQPSHFFKHAIYQSERMIKIVQEFLEKPEYLGNSTVLQQILSYF